MKKKKSKGNGLFGSFGKIGIPQPFFIKHEMMQPKLQRAMKKNIRQDKGIVYGEMSTQTQTGKLPLFQRKTFDWDVFTKNPKKIADKVQQHLDKVWGSDHFYSKPAQHPGTHKVMSDGPDMKRGTEDDIGYADFTKTPKPAPKFIVKNGIRYRVLKEEVKARQTALADKSQEFRHDKDRQSLSAVNYAQAIKGRGVLVGFVRDAKGRKFKVYRK